MRKNQKIVFVSLVAFFFLFLSLFLIGEENSKHLSNDEMTSGDPGHPGWMEQWREMKTLGTGRVDRDLIGSIRDEQRQVGRRQDANLMDVKEIGPNNVGGRTRALLVDWSNTDHLLGGGVSGGLWQSFDRGANWVSVNDFASNLSVTDITQSPFDPAVFYYCSGEAAGNSAGIPGDGIYKSLDGGQSFEKLPASSIAAFDYCWKIAHSPVDSNTVYVATRSAGLYRTTDAGRHFRLVFSAGGRGITDVELFPDSSVLIGVHSMGIYYSPNGDSGSFVRQDTGLPSFGFRRIELAYCDSFPQVVYSILENSDGDGVTGLYRSDDGGMHWDSVGNPTAGLISFAFPWYCMTLSVKPDDPEYVLAGSTEMGYSLNAGKSWVKLKYSHADNHVSVFDPNDPEIFYVGNDGGVYRYHTSDAKYKMEDLNNGYNVTQFYAGSFFPEGTDFYGGTQDNGTQSTKNGAPEFEHIFGGDGAFNQINQQFPTVAYVSWQNGHIYSTYNAQQPKPAFSKIMNEMDEDGDNSIDDGAWFINPFEINRKNGFHLFFPTRKRLWMSITGGSNWIPITHNLSSAGQPYSVGISNTLDPMVYLGGSNAMLFRIDSAYTMTGPEPAANLSSTVPDSVTNDFIACIAVSPSTDSVIYVAFSNFSVNPRIYKVIYADTDTPQWISLQSNLPAGLPVNWVEVSPLSDSVLILATDFGVYSSLDAGNSWQLEPDLPKVSVHQLRLRHSDGKLFIFTHGRGAFTATIPGDFSKLPSGREEILSENWNDLKVFPNPAGAEIRVEHSFVNGPVHYQVLDLNGRTHLNGVLPDDGRIGLQGLENGSFLLLLRSNNHSMGRRFVHNR